MKKSRNSIFDRKILRKQSKSKTVLIKVPLIQKEKLKEIKKRFYSEQDLENFKNYKKYLKKKRNVLQNNFENIFSGSENSYSSTYNSTNRTKFYSEKNIKKPSLLLNQDNTLFSKFQQGMKLMNINNPINNNKLLKKSRYSSQSMKNVFLNPNLFNNNNNEKRKNLNYLTQFLSNEQKFFESRNLSNNIPIKLVKFKTRNLNPLYSTLSYNSSLIKEKNKRKSMEINCNEKKVNLSWNKLNKSNLEKNKNILLKRNDCNNSDLNIDKEKFQNFIRKQSIESINNLKYGFISTFKKRKPREGKKKKSKIYKRQLSRISESSKNELNEINGNKYKSQKIIIDISKRRKAKINIFNFSNSEEENNENNIFSGNLSSNNEYKSKSQKFLDFYTKYFQFKHKNLKEKMKKFLEDEIEVTLNMIDSRNYHQKKKYIENIQEGIKINLECKKDKYPHQTDNFFIVKNSIKDNNFKVIHKKQEKFTLDYKPKILRHSTPFCYKFQKIISFEIKDLILNKKRVKELIKKYFEIDLVQKIIDENYFHNDYKNEEKPIIENFKRKNKKRLKTLKQKNNTILETLIPYLDNLPREDFYFILKFCQIDYDYHIIPDKFQIKLSKIKFRFPNIHFSTSKLTLSLKKQQNIFHSESQKDKLKILDKNLLKKALKNGNYFERKSPKDKKKKLLTIRTLKNTYKQIYQRIIERRHTQIRGNKLNMISKANELKYKIIKSLNSHIDEIIFYIKDRNYPGFISTFEKYILDPDIKDSNGNSLLSLAVQSNSFQIVNYLLNIGADPNISNDNYNTPLHFALTFHNYEIADMLIQRGANEKASNKRGMTPWQCLDNGFSII